MSTYAVIETGGKQYRVQPGDVLEVERLEADPGSTVELPSVVLLVENGSVRVGKPTVPGAKVIATVQANERSKKVTVFKFKRKVRYRRKKGHRQPFTRLLIKEISVA